MFFDLLIVRRLPSGDSHHGLLLAENHVLPCALGRNSTTILKREGDGATPAFVAMRPQSVWYRHDRVMRPKSTFPTRSITATDGWCDAPAHPSYNEWVRLPFDSSHETMTRDDPLYDICIVLDFNRFPRARRRFGGSAIFLHCAKPGYPPTAGCIALARADLQWLLPHLHRGTRIIVDR